MTRAFIGGLVLLTAISSATPASGQEKKADDPARPFFAKHCQECHSGLKPKGGFRPDSLSRAFDDKTNRERWLDVLEQLKTGAIFGRASWPV